MENKKLITIAKANIWQAVADYRAHTDETDVLDNISDAFVDQLATDSVNAKADLRALFAASPAWNEELQALVINGSRTHNPDFDLIHALAHDIFAPIKWKYDYATVTKIDRAVLFFSDPYGDSANYIQAIKSLAPRAYAPNKKPSRIFKALCDALGATDNSAGSQFQKLFAQLADELSARKINFKLFVSINPAHFLTMSNPKHDNRGSTMISCHSLNCTEYPYNCGCTGYARDSVSFIVFTASEPDNPETLNNRKTSRQIFAYKPNNGVLLQSRMYTTKSGGSYGGVHGDTEDGKLYRDLVQRELSSLENAPNLWATRDYHHNEFNINIREGDGFGGYADWREFSDCAKISVRQDHKYDYRSFEIGTYGLCICCGEQISEGLYCDDCNPEYEVCDCCGDRCNETTEVYNLHGELIRVCNDCLHSGYARCEHCGEYHHFDDMTFICESFYVCQSCLEDYYTICDCCGNYELIDEMRTAVNRNGYEIDICPACVDNYQVCDDCGRYVHPDDAIEVHDRHGNLITVCPDCRYNTRYEKCTVCGEIFYEDALTDGICANCKNNKGGDSE